MLERKKTNREPRNYSDTNIYKNKIKDLLYLRIQEWYLIYMPLVKTRLKLGFGPHFVYISNRENN